MKKYEPSKIEKKWQKTWEKSDIYKAQDLAKKPKWYSLIEFPYPSGSGLHVGHIRSNTAMDIISRKRRMEGYNVLYPIGWDAFGLPTENYAIKTGIAPQVATKKNTDTFRKQLKSLGFSFDWNREVDTTNPQYYKWTQWLFLQFFKHGLAYKAKAEINWCPKDKIGLANEEVEDGKCERCGSQVEKRMKEQWMLKMTSYAEKLLDGLTAQDEEDELDFISEVRTQQENWIGRSYGAEIEFPVVGSPGKIKIFTTRPDTIFGATFLVIAPEHPRLLQALNDPNALLKNKDEVRAYIEASKSKTEIERLSQDREKTGVELRGLRVINPATKEEIPVWASDYVLANYGTGIIMAVPAHDERDLAFAKKFKLPVRKVIKPVLNRTARSATDLAAGASLELTLESECWTGPGELVNSGSFSGKMNYDVIADMGQAFGTMKVVYKIRDWVFSRQRYWGEPIPLVFCPECAKNSNRSQETSNTGESLNPGWVAVLDKDLPVKLPRVKKYQPTDTGESPLSKIESWVQTKCPTCKGPAQRETDTMPNWAGSSWYYLAYLLDQKTFKSQVSIETWNSQLDNLRYWLPVDWYNGGMEHATRHLLYARFWNLFLHDIGLVPVGEPFKKRTAHGTILAKDGQKMSKSLGNVVNPDELVKEFGADALRLYEMFIGPFDQAVSWDERGILGTARFLDRVWRVGQQIINRKEQVTSSKEQIALLHKTLKKVTNDIEKMQFNTAVSAMMMFINELDLESPALAKKDWEMFLKILAPFSPFITEELWKELGNKTTIHVEHWPAYDEKLILDDTFDLVIQVNSRTRAKVTAPWNISEDDAKKLALSQEEVKKWVVGEVKRVVFVPNRLINLIIPPSK